MKKVSKYVPYLMFIIALGFNSCSNDNVNEENVNIEKSVQFEGKSKTVGEMHNIALNRYLESDYEITDNTTRMEIYDQMFELMEINSNDAAKIISSVEYFDLNQTYSEINHKTEVDFVLQFLRSNNIQIEIIQLIELGQTRLLNQMDFDKVIVKNDINNQRVFNNFKDVYFSSFEFWSNYQNDELTFVMKRCTKGDANAELIMADAAGAAAGMLGGPFGSIFAGAAASLLAARAQDDCGGCISNC